MDDCFLLNQYQKSIQENHYLRNSRQKCHRQFEIDNTLVQGLLLALPLNQIVLPAIPEHFDYLDSYPSVLHI